MQVDERTGRLDTVLEAVREECSVPPAAPGFLAGFRARRDAWNDRGAQTAVWRLLALRLAPAGALAALAAMAFTVGLETAPAGTAPTETPSAETLAPVAEYEDPFAAGLEEAGVATVAVADDGDYELLAVLYEPLGTR